MLKTIARAAFAAFFSFIVLPQASADHSLTHFGLVLRETSKVPVRLFICKTKEDADSVLIANEQGGSEGAYRRFLYLWDPLYDDGSFRCVLVSEPVTPLEILRKTTITVIRGGKPIRVEGTLIKLRVESENFPDEYFSPVSIPVAEDRSIKL